MRVEMSRFRVLPGKAERVDAWLQLLNDRMPETLATLEREAMKFEAIFRERIGADDYLTWVTVQDEKGADVRTSPHEIDRLHLAFWSECIDDTYGRHDAQPQVINGAARDRRGHALARPGRIACAVRGARDHLPPAHLTGDRAPRPAARLADRSGPILTHQTSPRSNLFQRNTTGASLNSAMPATMRALSSSTESTRM
jgi:hypothetical protein